MNTTMYSKLVKLPMAQLAAVAGQLGAPKVGDKDTVAKNCCLYKDYDVQVAINHVMTSPIPAPVSAAVQSFEDAIVASPTFNRLLRTIAAC